MYEIIKSVINQGNYELTDILKKIDIMWLQGNVTEEQRTELIGFAQANAKPENSYASLQNQIDALFENLKEIVKAVKTNTDAIATLKGEEVIPEESEEYPEYVQPTGAHDSYHKGDKITASSRA